MSLIDAFYEPEMMAAAGRIESVAALVRHRCRLLRLAASGCGWDGDGARAFGHSARVAIARSARAADELDAAAAALRRHGAAVAHEQAAQAARQREAERRIVERTAHLLRVPLP